MERFSPADIFGGDNVGVSGQIGMLWQQVRTPLIVPLLKVMVIVCLGMSLMLFVERVYMGIVIVLIKLFGWKPENKYKWEPMKEDLELGNFNYPMVLVQIPMYNEKEVIFFNLLSCFNFNLFFFLFYTYENYLIF